MIDAPDHLVLASQSPRRRLLLEHAAVAFRIEIPSDSVEDEIRATETTSDYVMRLALQKAEAVLPLVGSNEVILACDTVAECDGQVLGKPDDVAHAKAMLQSMRGREHHVISGVCLCNGDGTEKRLDYDVTRLRMEHISDAAIDEYLATGLWEGKAGAFGYQDGIDWVQVLAGSESNVVGLPLECLERMFELWKECP